MAETEQSQDVAGPAAASFEGLGAAAAKAGAKAGGLGPAPVHLWNPPFCGDIGMRIARDGTWFYQGTPIGRPAMVRLFASILRRDPDRFVLVTPVEKVAIEVEDAPFLAVEMTVDEGPAGPSLRFRTNIDDEVVADATHPLRFAPGPSGGLKPYILVRGGLEALVTRPLFHDLVARGETRDIDGAPLYGVASAGVFFPMAPAGDLEDLA